MSKESPSHGDLPADGALANGAWAQDALTQDMLPRDPRAHSASRAGAPDERATLREQEALMGSSADDDALINREEPPYESSASLRLANGPLAGPVLCRVVSIVLARANCPMDRMDDAMLICDALSAHAPMHAADGHLAYAVSARAGQFELRVGELAEQAASSLVEDAVLPGVGSVLERMTDELRIEPSSDGFGEELVLGLSF